MSFKNHKTKTLALTGTCLGLLLCMGIHAAIAEEPGNNTVRYEPIADFVFKPGNHRTLGYLNLMAPLYQNSDNLLFGDARFMMDDRDASEGNLGLGYRHVLNNDSIVGGYAFIDRRRSTEDNYFTQATIGAEFLKEAYEFRANGYVPLSDEKTIQGAPSVGFSGTTVTIDDGTSTEEGLWGFDAEGGVKIPNLRWDTRAFAAYYHFEGDKTDAEVDGGRVRFYTEPVEWLRIGGEIQHDNLRDTTAYAEVRVRIPFGGYESRKQNNIRSRMMEPVIRDVDIVTKTRDTSAANLVGVTGSPGQYVDVYVVDNTAAGGGNGTFATPYNTLAAAQAATNVGDTVYVRTGSGTTGQSTGITLSDNNSRLIGQGIALQLDRDVLDVRSDLADFASAQIIRPAGTAPTISNSGGDGVTVTGNSVTVSGLTVNASSDDNILVSNANNFTISHNTISSAGDDGIQVDITSGTKNGTISSNTITGGATDSIEIATNGGQLGSSSSRFQVTGNTMTGATNTGLFMQTTNSGILYVNAAQNTISNTVNYFGIDLNVNTAATADAVLNSNIITDNGRSGVILTSLASGTTLNTSMSYNTITGNGVAADANYDNGFQTVMAAGSAMNADLGGGTLGSTAHNRIHSNAGHELDIDLNDGTLKAQGNWWGVNTGLAGGEENVTGTEDIDSSNFLTSDPGPI